MYEHTLGHSLNELFDRFCDGLVGTGKFNLRTSNNLCSLREPNLEYYINSGTLNQIANKRYKHESDILVHYVDFAKLTSLAGLDCSSEICSMFLRYMTNHSSLLPLLATFIDNEVFVYQLANNRQGYLPQITANRDYLKFSLLEESGLTAWEISVFQRIASYTYSLLYELLYNVHHFSYFAAANPPGSLTSSCAYLRCLHDEYCAEANAYYLRLAYSGDLAGLGQEIKFTLGIVVDTLKYCFPPPGMSKYPASFCRDQIDADLSEVIERRFFSPLLLRVRAASTNPNIDATR